ncbi:MAG TPA: histidine phosphatase family protein, partial [Candidatus Sulfotelmatobacter sp.]|nr:histidine phosphatase family protein [Candidatus Sulfotelmatobacter sp.]
EEIRAIDGDVAVFAHRDLLRMLTARWLGLPPEAGRLFTIATGTLSILGWEAETPVLLTWNEDCHLRS